MTADSALQEKLRLVGFAEDSLRERISELESENAELWLQNQKRRFEISASAGANTRKRRQLRKPRRRCLWCRAMRWFTKMKVGLSDAMAKVSASSVQNPYKNATQ